MRTERAGSAVLIELETRDARVAGTPLANPSAGAKITLIDPGGATVLDKVAMTNQSTGLYRYTHQSSAADPLGVYTAWFESQDGSTIVQTPDTIVFELIAR